MRVVLCAVAALVPSFALAVHEIEPMALQDDHFRGFSEPQSPFESDKHGVETFEKMIAQTPHYFERERATTAMYDAGKARLGNPAHKAWFDEHERAKKRQYLVYSNPQLKYAMREHFRQRYPDWRRDETHFAERLLAEGRLNRAPDPIFSRGHDVIRLPGDQAGYQKYNKDYEKNQKKLQEKMQKKTQAGLQRRGLERRTFGGEAPSLFEPQPRMVEEFERAQQAHPQVEAVMHQQAHNPELRQWALERLPGDRSARRGPMPAARKAELVAAMRNTRIADRAAADPRLKYAVRAHFRQRYPYPWRGGAGGEDTFERVKAEGRLNRVPDPHQGQGEVHALPDKQNLERWKTETSHKDTEAASGGRHVFVGLAPFTEPYSHDLFKDRHT